MRNVRKRSSLVWMAGLLLLVWACGGGGGSPTAPASSGTVTFEGEAATCGTPPCGGGGNKGGGNKGQDVDWQLTASGPLGNASKSYTFPSSDSMSFDAFPLDMDVLESSGVANADICFSDTSYNGSPIVIETDKQNPSQIRVTYEFTGFRLERNGQGGREIAYSIVFTDIVATSGDFSPPWPPKVGEVTLTGAAYSVSGVAQRNNTCNGVGVLPSNLVLTLCGGGAC